MIRKSLNILRVIKSQVQIRKTTNQDGDMTIDQHTRLEAMFKFLPNSANDNHASRLLQLLRSHGIKRTRDVSPTEWSLLIERVMGKALQA